MYIVLEYLLLENFIINLLMLYLNKIFLNIEVSYKRLVLGSLVASLYSLVYFYPLTYFSTKLLYKIMFTLLIIRISYKYYNLKIYLKELLGFFIISFIFAGATIGAYYTSNNFHNILNREIDVSGSFPVIYLVFGVFISVIIAKIVFKYFNQRSIKSNFIADVIIKYKGKQTFLRALLDTGHSLINPFTGDKVMVVEYEKLKSLVPPLVSELIAANENNNYKAVELILDELQDEIKLNIIPFKSIGRNGTLFAFKPDAVIVYHMEKEIVISDILIGIYSNSLTKEMGYSGLLHYELIDGGVENEFVEVQN